MTNFTNEAYEEIILNTIDSLRQRKARPDFDRICHMIQRRHDIKAETTVVHLERLVTERTVIKVDYKGSTSYRNAAKWKKARHFDKAIPSKMMTLMRSALKATTGPNGSAVGDVVMWFQRYMKPVDTLPQAYQQSVPDKCDNNNTITNGTSVPASEQYVTANEVAVKAFKRDLRATLMQKVGLVLKRETVLGTVKKLPNGHYVLGPSSPKPDVESPVNGPSVDELLSNSSNGPMDLSCHTTVHSPEEKIAKQPEPVSPDSPQPGLTNNLEEEDLVLTVADIMGPLVFVPKSERMKMVAIKPKPSQVAAEQGISSSSSSSSAVLGAGPPPAAKINSPPNNTPQSQCVLQESLHKNAAILEIQTSPINLGTAHIPLAPPVQPEQTTDARSLPLKSTPEPTPLDLLPQADVPAKFAAPRSTEKVVPTKVLEKVPGKRGRPPLSNKKKKLKKSLDDSGPKNIKLETNGTTGATGNSSSPPDTNHVTNTNSSSSSTSSSSSSHAPPSSADRQDNQVPEEDQTPPDDHKMVAATILNDEDRCDYCLNTSASNRNGIPESLLICKDCQAKAHPSCMSYSTELAERAQHSPWQCIDCKTCYICNDSNDPDDMLFCDACDKGYHMNCHQPPVYDKPTGKWVCGRCTDESEYDMTVNNEYHYVPETNGGSLSPYAPSPVPFNPDNNQGLFQHDGVSERKIYHDPDNPTLPRLADVLTTHIPDASNWTSSDVEEYFREMGFVEQAGEFKEQEIDGKSLLLLKRDDVLDGMSFELGPALKIYYLVERLQTKGENFRN